MSALRSMETTHKSTVRSPSYHTAKQTCGYKLNELYVALSTECYVSL